MDKINELDNVIRREYRALFPSLGPGVSFSHRHLATSSAPVYLFELQDGRGQRLRFVAKFCEQFAHNNLGVSEYENLRFCERHWQLANALTPRPIAFIGELNCLLSQYIEGQPVRAVLTREGFWHYFDGPSRLLSDLATRAAHWLGHYHTLDGCISEAGLPPDHIDEIKDYVDDQRPTRRRARLLSIVGTGSSLLGRLKRLLSILSHNAGSIRCEHSRQHGDYKPSNMIWSEGKLYVFDLPYNWPAPRVRDVALFLTHLDLFRYFRLMRAWQTGAYRSKFVEAYSAWCGTGQWDHLVFLFYRLQCLLIECEYHGLLTARLSPMRRSVFRAYCRWVYTVRARRITSLTGELPSGVVLFPRGCTDV